MDKTSKDPSGAQELLAIKKQLAEILARLSRLDVVESRLEHAIPFITENSNRLAGSQSIYLGDHTAVTFLRNGQRIFVDTRSWDVGVHLLTLGEWEQTDMALFGKLLAPGDTVLDIGANHGVYALHAALAVGPRGQVHAFEPNPRLASLADMSFKINGFAERAQVHRLGVSDVSRKAHLFSSNVLSGNGAILEASFSANDEATECQLEPLDKLFPEPGFRVDTIKMDIEGHEGFALRGMRQLLARSPNVKIMMEYAPAWLVRAGFAPEALFSLIQELGFKIWSFSPSGRLSRAVPQDLLTTDKDVQNLLLARQMPSVFL
ncbi:MAG: FkbM family methyltransferase [Alphaproteobacteria bacterium]